MAGCTLWLSHENQHSSNGVQLSSVLYNTSSACQQYCVNMDECIAVDFSPAENKCWVHLDAENLLPNSTFNIAGVTQYRINRTCVPTASPTPRMPITLMPIMPVGNSTINPNAGEPFCVADRHEF